MQSSPPSQAQLEHFQNNLYTWHQLNPRPLPWKETRNPYVIWLSEIILQQTRVEQGLPYYHRFVSQYPTVQHLADAEDDEVMKLWEGLGYYSRARSLLVAARYVANELGGVFPDNLEGLLKLKGVGPYTAAAIGSFAFNLPLAVLDGNVYRVLSRYFGWQLAIDANSAPNKYGELAQTLLDKENPGLWNQAMMDFGATHCKPALPLCATCPMADMCVARELGMVGALPRKEKKIVKRTRYFQFQIFRKGPFTWIQRRGEGDIWNGLYQFPLIETADAPVVGQVFKEQLTHQTIIAVFQEHKVADDFEPDANWLAVQWEELPRYAFPKIVHQYFEKRQLQLF